MDSAKQPVINMILYIVSIKDPQVRIGQFKYKMRMRKPMNEALRWYREKHDMTLAPAKFSATEGILKPIHIKKFISISRIGGKRPDSIIALQKVMKE